MAFDTATFLHQLQSKSLNDLLDQLEIDLSHVGQGNAENAQKILLKMDFAFQAINEMTQKGNQNKAEAAQFEYLANGLEKNAKAFLKDLGGNEKLEQLRQAYSPQKERRWWYPDEVLNRQAKKTVRTISLSIAAVAILVLILAVIYRFFLMPDPRVAATYDHQMNAQQALSQNNLPKALNEVDLALSYSPDDASLMTLRGVIEQKLGMTDISGADFTAAEEKLGNRETFLLTRAQMWQQVGDFNAALMDTQTVLQMDPTSAEGYFYQGHAEESLQDYNDAVNDYNKASELADAQGKVELNGTIRVTLAMLLQSMPVAPSPAPQGTFTPAPK